MAHENPHPCSCFGGFCWKQLCHERTINKAQAKRNREEAPTCEAPAANAAPVFKPRHGTQVSIERDGVTYEHYTMPPGRIPPKR